MDIEVTTDGTAAVVRVSGELDAHRCDVLAAALGEVLDGGISDLVIDAAGLAFIDSSGISTFLDARERVTAGGGTFVLRDPTPAVRRVVEITGLVEALGVEPPEAAT